MFTDGELIDIATKAMDAKAQAEADGNDDIRTKCFALAAAASALRSDLR